MNESKWVNQSEWIRVNQSKWNKVNESKWVKSEWIKVSESKWMKQSEWIKVNESKWVNQSKWISGWIKVNELKWVNQSEWIKMNELKRNYNKGYTIVHGYCLLAGIWNANRDLSILPVTSNRIWNYFHTVFPSTTRSTKFCVQHATKWPQSGWW